MTDPEVKRLTELAEVADERDCALRENARLRARLDAITRSQQPPPLSPAETLECAEEMLRRIAASACLDLDATEAAAIVAELDRLRAERAAMSARATVAETRHAAESEHLIAHGREAERAAIAEWLRDYSHGPHGNIAAKDKP